MRTRTLPPVDELLAALAELGVADAPREGDTESLQGLLDLALFVAEHQKDVSFPGFSWEDPGFLARDGKVGLRFAFARLDARDAETLRAQLAAQVARAPAPRALLAIDARPTGLREFELSHALYGEVTLFEHRRRPPESIDLRIDAARERGWVKTLKEHNLLPGRGLVVLDEHQGLLLRDAQLQRVGGMLILLPNGHTHLWLNPVAPEGDPELQYWLAWGRGVGGASEWREVLRVDAADEDAP